MDRKASELILNNLTTMSDLSEEDVLKLIRRALYFKEGGNIPSFDKPYFVTNLFFEPSTRTHKSFEMAERKLGLNVMEFDAKTSSVNKGETLYDTILTMSALGVDLCVIRHSRDEYYEELIESDSITTAIVNGGDGSGQHPSQSLLDLMTIYEEFHHFSDLKVVICGDITHSRVAKSNMQILTRLGATIYFSGPKEWYSAEFDQYGQFVALDDIIDQVDVIMLLRVQHERHTEEGNGFSKRDYHSQYGLTIERYQELSDKTIILHPAPVNRDVEIADELVESPKSRIVEQMKNGVFVRMALLEAILQSRS